MFANWQAALLQLACLIFLAAKLRQKGAAHSRKTSARHKKSARRRYGWLYRNSLSLSLLALFGLAFIGHVFAATRAFNEQGAMAGQHPMAMVSYFFSASFWFKTLQTWQAEFIALVFYLILSIFTRQEDSAESKHLDAPNSATGDTNESRGLFTTRKAASAREQITGDRIPIIGALINLLSTRRYCSDDG